MHAFRAGASHDLAVVRVPRVPALLAAGHPARQQLQLRRGQFVVQPAGHLLFYRTCRHEPLVPSPGPTSGRILSSIASRARKIRDRTVPTGQSIAAAISS